jgi:hypothetical protein
MMIERGYDGSFEGLLGILAGVCRGDPLPDRIRRLPFRKEAGQPDLFGSGGAPYPACGRDGSALAEDFFELSAGAYDSFLCGWMSEFPIEADCVRFGGRVFSAARAAAERTGCGMGSPEARRGAEQGASDRGDAAVRAVLNAAYKVRHETDRLSGLLRFSPDSRGTYIARCAPDHFILPRLAAYFSRRFGDAPWLIVDEKRDLCLLGAGGGEPRLASPAAFAGEMAGGAGGLSPREDPWEELWRTYHRAINNPGRKNPGLQQQLMPVRYWKYLPEMSGRGGFAAALQH